ncbi:MAG: hypothetical protein E7613_03720 [Ruminococcaceae bacterium]|nr:hypothetical protein [Oscillospiraceae bacterium]
MITEQYYFLSILIMAFSAVLTLVGLIFACVQLFQIRKNRQKQFDQSRREKTVEMVAFYIKNTNRETRAVEKIVAGFSDEQCQELYNGTPFQIDEKTRDKICQVCPHKQECEHLKKSSEHECQLKKDSYYIVDGTVLQFIRSNIISYLNNLECVLLSWQLGIVEQSVIEEQFAFLDKKRQRERALETFRMIAGSGRSYPAIEKFYQHLTQKRSDEAKLTLKKILN